VLGIAGGWFAAGLIAGRRRRDLLAAAADIEQARRDAAAADESASMLIHVGDTVRDLLSCPRTREEVCRAATELAGARAALIYEPRGEGELTCTATAGLDFSQGPVSVAPVSRAQRAFDVARPVFLAGAREDRVASAALWRAGGRPASVLYQPMVYAGRTLGVMAAGWRDAIPFDGAQCAAVALLAHEAAAMIARAAGEADAGAAADRCPTDPLTGLPNLAGLRAQLGSVLARASPLAAVAVDLDGFVHDNAAHGHPAGDRLLKAAVAAWLQTLRPGDCLARVGGEEFILLLPGCGTPAAVGVARRLDELIPDEQTCSVGVAVLRDGEAGESLLARAQRALHDAKAAGRGVGLGDPGLD
jgi:diguanylate cyclase (GGDEF)-like protein